MDPKYRIQETAAGLCEWATKNMAFNLNFIPDEKLDWKPAPEANSAFEIVAHLLSVIKGINGMIVGGESMPDVTHPTTREEARQALVAAGSEFATTVRALPDDRLPEILQTSFGPMPVSFMITVPMTDAVHHHGQIAYIQSLLGDAEAHFDLSLLATRM